MNQEIKERVLTLAVDALLIGTWWGIIRTGSVAAGCQAWVIQACAPQQALSELSQGRAPAGRGNSRKHLVWPVGKSCSSSRGQVSGNHMNSQHHSCLLAGDGGRCSPWIPPQEAGRRPSASEHSPHFLSQPGPPQSPHHLPQIHSCLFSHPLTPPQVHSLPALS